MEYDRTYALMEKIELRYTAEELCEILGLTAFEILDAFEYKWINNKELLENLDALP
jgi:hypothetical protein